MDVVVTDRTTAGAETARLLLAGLPSPVTLRELIRFRVREEVARHNAGGPSPATGLVPPTPAEAALNAGVARPPRRLDWEQQADAAVAAFLRNGFFVFAGGRQYEALDDEVPLADMDEVSFVRLVPLVGG